MWGWAAVSKGGVGSGVGRGGCREEGEGGGSFQWARAGRYEDDVGRCAEGAGRCAAGVRRCAERVGR